MKRFMADEKAEGPVRVGDMLGAYLEKAGLKETVSRAEVLDEWDEKVGEAVAKVTRARGLRGAALIVEVRSSSWLMELSLLKEEVLRRLNEGRKEGLIENIVFVLAEDTTP